MSIHSLVFPKAKAIIAYSGGLDSSVLLHCAYRQGLDVVVVHIDHAMRETSHEDAFFCQQQCDTYGYACNVITLSNPPRSEEEARNARYDILYSELQKMNRDMIFLAHHKDDQAETILMQMIRGVAIPHPMEEYNGVLYRPFLPYTKSEIRLYAKEHTLLYKEDPTNSQEIYTRNKLRLSVFPQLESINSRVKDHIIQCAESMQEYKRFAHAMAKAFLAERTSFSRNEFLSQDILLQSEIIKTLAPHLYRVHIEEVITMIQRGVSLKSKHGFTFEYGIVRYNAL